MRYFYDFESPALSEKLPGYLDEISGLTSIDDSTLAAIEDESGVLYFLDSRTGKVDRRQKFGPDGDYEAIEIVRDTIYVLRSDGDVYEIADWRTDSPSVNKNETFLSIRHDTEGLAFDSASNSLLILCKEYAGKQMSGLKSIYSYDLSGDSLKTAPLYAINFDSKKRDDFPGRLVDFQYSRSKLRGFKPSAIAVHPLSGNLYILSSAWKAVVVMDRSGRIVSVTELEGKNYRQPEGITFDRYGTLFISSEANGKDAYLFSFRPIIGDS